LNSGGTISAEATRAFELVNVSILDTVLRPPATYKYDEKEAPIIQ